MGSWWWRRAAAAAAVALDDDLSIKEATVKEGGRDMERRKEPQVASVVRREGQTGSSI